MLEPAKLATNCVSANGNMSLRLAAALRGLLGCDTRQLSPGLPTAEADTTPVAEDLASPLGCGLDRPGACFVYDEAGTAPASPASRNALPTPSESVTPLGSTCS